MLHTLMSLPSWRNGWAHPGIAWLAARASLCVRTAKSGVREAVSSEWLTEHLRAGKTTEYRLAAPPSCHVPPLRVTPLMGRPPSHGPPHGMTPLTRDPTPPSRGNPHPPPLMSPNSRTQGPKELPPQQQVTYSEEEKRLASEESLLRREENDPSFRVGSRSRYLAGVIARFVPGEVAELLDHRRERLLREASVQLAAQEAADEVAREKAFAEHAARALSRMDPDAIAALDLAAGIPAHHSSLARGGNEIALREARALRLAYLTKNPPTD